MNSYRNLTGKSEGKSPLGRYGHRWNIIVRLIREIGWGGIEWIDLARNRV